MIAPGGTVIVAVPSDGLGTRRIACRGKPVDGGSYLTCTPMASTIDRIAGSPSGTAATASDTPSSKT